MDSPSRDESGNARRVKMRDFSLPVDEDYLILCLLLPGCLQKRQSIAPSDEGTQAGEFPFPYPKQRSDHSKLDGGKSLARSAVEVFTGASAETGTKEAYPVQKQWFPVSNLYGLRFSLLSKEEVQPLQQGLDLPGSFS
jgi:hypothetical protein